MMLIISLLVAASLTAPVQTTDAMRCANRLVSIGDTRLELESYCGLPAHIASRPVADQFRLADGPPDATSIYEVIETWTYASPGDLVRLVTIKRGLVNRIRVVGTRDPGEGSGCVPTILRDQATLGEVFLRCGSPQDETRWIEERRTGRRGSHIKQSLVAHDRWVYDPGPGHLLRIFEFENGELVSVTTAGRLSAAEGESLAQPR